MTFTVRCPAKVNRFLSVGPPDATGYHPIRTIFQAIGLFDTLTVSLGGDRTEITSNWAHLPPKNTLTRVLALAGELVDIPPLQIHLEKAIPAESGLGGGSSNAAGLLRVLPKLVDGPLPWNSECEIAASVGADVPFFLVGGLSRAEGYGEKLTSLPERETEWLVVVRPAVGVSTGEAYRSLDAAPRDWREFPGEGTDDFYNDFERVAPCECMDFVEHLTVHGAKGALLSGSGSAVFGIFDREEKAKEVAVTIPSRDADVWVVPTLTREESLWIS